MKEFFSSVSPDAWIQTIGSVIGTLIGTLLAGLISIGIYRKQANDKEKEAIEIFKRKYKRVQNMLKPALPFYESLIINWDDMELKQDQIKSYKDVTYELKDSADSIPDSSIPNIVYDDFNSLKGIINKLRLYFFLYGDEEQRHKVSKEGLKDSFQTLDTLNKTIEKKIN